MRQYALLAHQSTIEHVVLIVEKKQHVTAISSCVVESYYTQQVEN